MPALAWMLLRIASHRFAAWAVLILLAGYYSNTDQSPLNAVGPALAWGVIASACRLFLRSGPSRFLPRNKPVPPSQIALSVAPRFEDAACPALPEMIDALPEDVQKLIQPPGAHRL